jgi:heat shock protein HslJ
MAVVILAGAFALLNSYIYNEKQGDPSDITSKTWVWVSALYNDGREVEPEKANAFTATFQKDGTFTATTDCNHLSGSYTTGEGTIAFNNFAFTKMYCEGSQENLFMQLLNDSTQYHISDDGQLILGLKFDSGSVMFR